MEVMTLPIPKIKTEVIDNLAARFPRVTVEPDVTTMEQVMYSAGEQNVINYLRSCIEDSTTHNYGTPA